MSKRVLSGIQPTSDSFHIGNHLGALQNWVKMQAEFDCFYFIADLHAITVDQDPDRLRERTLKAYAQLIALGVDPEKSVLFVQSQVPEHAQLMWVMSCLTGIGEANRMTQFKDKVAKGGSTSASVGLLTYPILQSADILLYQADAVPVGEDQRQHLELTRDLAIRFNSRYGQIFTVPEPHIVKATAKIQDLQEPTAKMSKSAPTGCINLLDPLKITEKKIKSAVTDSDSVVAFDPAKKAGVSNLLTILSAYTNTDVNDLVTSFAGRMYGDLKKETADAVLAFTEPFQARVNELLADQGELIRLMRNGAQQAREVSAQTLAAVYEKIGFSST
ncbi:MAG: tryptophan--tRNA ligase [Actinobacteria bacterium]|nr:tryptophan--tRNA ligase [Actinomycetota bacterium]NBY15319.1 tryptophan--tRNA ligase [Actinomycetota bacterium]